MLARIAGKRGASGRGRNASTVQHRREVTTPELTLAELTPSRIGAVADDRRAHRICDIVTKRGVLGLGVSVPVRVSSKAAGTALRMSRAPMHT